jgi:PadR family transcriptional regulator, regulatory protein PadR
MTENNRRAKYYSLTRSGRKQLEAEQQLWDRTSSIMAMVLDSA